MYSPEGGVIERGGVLYELPGWLAADLEAVRPLAEEPGLPWRTILLSLVGALALACLALLARRLDPDGRGKKARLGPV